jgi:radical SAM superfamily enzyme YgiQ (UPF0313 family)
MKVLLCYPSLLPGQKPKYGLQPLGILYIAAVLRHHGIAVEVLDADIDGLTVPEMVERIRRSAPDLVGFSLMTPQLPSALAVSAALKRACPNLPIVLGGAHIDSTHEDTFHIADCFDFAIYGEGEYALLEVVQRLERSRSDLASCLKGIGNVIYRDPSGRVVKNPARPFLADLGELPSVDYDMLDVSRYVIPTMTGRYVISMMLSRGCPFRCTFCDAPLTMGKKLRFWPIERVLADITRCIERYGCRNFVFKDSTFTANRRWAERFCDALLDSGLNIRWRCNTRVNLVPQPLLVKMKQAGCQVINFGVESGDPQILRNIQKEVRLEDVYDAHRRCRQLGIRTYATFLIGCPGETEQTVRATIRLARQIRPNLAMFFVATAYPGTPLYEQAVREGLVEPRWWANQEWDPRRNSAFQVRWGWTAKGAIRIPGFDAERWQRRATRAFYLRPYFVWDTLRHTLKDPAFVRHLLSLGAELLPLHRLQLRRRVDQRLEAIDPFRTHGRCPSAPDWGYAPRREAVRQP